MKRKKTEDKRFFSLIELCLSLSVLGIVASFLSWQTHDLYLSHQLQAGVKILMIELRQMQSLALSHRTDFAMDLYFDAQRKEWLYTCSTDEPIYLYTHKKKIPLPGVKTIHRNGTPSQQIHLSVYSSGRIEPGEQIEFAGKSHRYALDLSATPQIKLYEKKDG